MLVVGCTVEEDPWRSLDESLTEWLLVEEGTGVCTTRNTEEWLLVCIESSEPDPLEKKIYNNEA